MLLGKEFFKFALVEADNDVIIDNYYRNTHLLGFLHHFPGFFSVGARISVEICP